MTGSVIWFFRMECMPCTSLWQLCCVVSPSPQVSAAATNNFGYPKWTVHV